MALSVLASILVVAAVVKRGWPALALLSAGLFTALAALAAGISAEWVETLDVTMVDRFAAADRHRVLTIADATFRAIGDPKDVAIVAAICGGLLSLRARSALPLVMVLGAVALSVSVEHSFKALVGRTVRVATPGRHPSVLLEYLHSYPSGHVAGSAALVGTIAVLLGATHGRALRVALGVVAVVCVLCVAIMALYVRAHLFSDVIGGMFLGGAIVSLAAAVLSARSRRGTFP